MRISGVRGLRPCRHCVPGCRVSIRCGFLGSGDQNTDGMANGGRYAFQSGADFWGPGTLTEESFHAQALVSIRCGFLGSGERPFTGYWPVTLDDQRFRDPCAADGRSLSQVRPTREWTLRGPGLFFNRLRSFNWVSIRCGFLGSGDCHHRAHHCHTRAAVSIRCGFLGSGDPVPHTDGPRPLVSIRCGFLGSGDSPPVCGGAELGKRGALRQPLLGCGPVMR